MAKHTGFAAAGLAALGVLALAPQASAQIAGNYDGTSADGQSVHFVVGTDPKTGGLAVTSATIFFAAPCKGAEVTLNTGWGYGLDAPISNRQVTNTTTGSYFSISFKLQFSADGQTATGGIYSISPDLYSPTGGIPTRALYCVSPKRTLTATYSAVTASDGAAVASKAKKVVPLHVIVAAP